MPEAYTTLWTNSRCQYLKQYNQEGARLEVLFGGPHISEPSFISYGVKAGDHIYPVRVYKGILYVIARMTVKRIMSLEEYIVQHPQLFANCDQSKRAAIQFEQYLELNPEKRYLAPTCTEEVVIGEAGTPQRLDITVPPELLARLRFRSRRKERGLKYIENGRLRNVLSLQGIYRLNEASAREIEALLGVAGMAPESATPSQPTLPDPT
jgi:hypothetical protein